MTFRQNFFLKDWLRNKLGVGLGLRLELVFGIGLVLVKPLLCYVLSIDILYTLDSASLLVKLKPEYSSGYPHLNRWRPC